MAHQLLNSKAVFFSTYPWPGGIYIKLFTLAKESFLLAVLAILAVPYEVMVTHNATILYSQNPYSALRRRDGCSPGDGALAASHLSVCLPLGMIP